MKLLYFFLLLATASISAQSLDAVRTSYVKVHEGDQAIAIFEKNLASVKEDSSVKDAYNGALMTLQSRLVKGVKNKKILFKDGVLLLEKAVLANSNNIEIRVIRLSIQENAPKFLKYRNDLDEDKNFILSNISQTTSAAVRKFVKGYVQQSSLFTDAEKSSL